MYHMCSCASKLAFAKWVEDTNMSLEEHVAVAPDVAEDVEITHEAEGSPSTRAPRSYCVARVLVHPRQMRFRFLRVYKHSGNKIAPSAWRRGHSISYTHASNIKALVQEDDPVVPGIHIDATTLLLDRLRKELNA
jgi:hypothetical protein